MELNYKFMFDFKDKIKLQPKTEDSSEILARTEVKEILTEKQDETKIDLTKIQVHSMPEKFFVNDNKKIINRLGQSGKKKISGLQKNILIGVLIGVLVVGLLGLAAFLFLKSIERPQNKQSTIEQPKSAPQIPDIKEQQDVKKEQNDSSLNYEPIDNNQDNNTNNNNTTTTTEENFLEEEELNLLPAIDTDSDLLSDAEEELWGTDASNKDTDGDGYLDGEEVLNLYNPNLGQGSKLADAELIKNYTNLDFGYAVVFPSKWALKADEFGEQIIFNSTTGEFVQIIVQQNYDGFLSAKSWYLSQNPAINEADLQEVLIGNWSGVRSPDRLNVYLTNNNYIYIIAMNVALKNELNYSTTYEMILNSFRLFENPL